MIGGVRVEMLVAHAVAWANDERRAELCDPSTRLVDPVPRLAGASRSRSTPAIEDELEEVHLAHTRGAGSLTVVVDHNRERHVLLSHERGRVLLVPGPDGDDFAAEALDLVVALAQLRGVLTAEQSPEVAKEHEDDRPLRPEVAEAPAFPL